MARKYKHGWAWLSHRRNRIITAGGGGGKSTMRSNFWEVACERHGMQPAVKGSHKQLKVSTPSCKKERFGGLGCPKCADEARTKARS